MLYASTTFPHTQPYFAITRIATFGKSFFCDFTLFFSVTFNLHTEKSEKAVPRTLNRVRELVVLRKPPALPGVQKSFSYGVEKRTSYDKIRVGLPTET